MVVMYEHESWTVRKRVKRQIYAFSTYGVGGYSFGQHSDKTDYGMERKAKRQMVDRSYGRVYI